MGASDACLARAVRLDQLDVTDLTSGQTLSRDVQGVRVYAVLRTDLHRALAVAAVTAGAEIATESVGVAAAPDGRLTVAGSGSGQDLRADLVIGADGVAFGGQSRDKQAGGPLRQPWPRGQNAA
jgi:flavin-dependent dehydrogenase